VRFFLSFVLAVLVITSGIAVVFLSTAEQGSWSLSFPMPRMASPVAASQEAAAEKRAVSSAVTVLKGQPIGDWTYSCSLNARTTKKQCSIAQQLTDEKSKSVVFAWSIVNDGAGNLVATWQTPTGVLVNRGVVVDLGARDPINVPYTSCIAGRCEAIANLPPDFIHSLARARIASATIFTVAGENLTFPVSVNGLADALDAVKASTAG
jgi:invasion protein IalB